MRLVMKKGLIGWMYPANIDESVDLIAFLFNIEANKKFYHRHIVDNPRIKFLV